MFSVRQIQLRESFSNSFWNTALALGRRLYHDISRQGNAKVGFDHTKKNAFEVLKEAKVTLPAQKLFENYDGTADFEMPRSVL